MVHRRYFTANTPSFQPTLKGAWDTSAAVVYRELGHRDGPLASVSQAETSTSNNWDMALLCLVMRLDFSGTIPVASPAIDIRYGRLASATSAFVGHFHAWVSTGATSTVRSTITIDAIGGTNWLTSSVFSFNNVSPTGAFAVTAGDYLVLEMGARGITTSATSVTASLYYGGLGPDPVTGDAVTNQDGWVDFYGTAEDLIPRLPLSGTPLMMAA